MTTRKEVNNEYREWIDERELLHAKCLYTLLGGHDYNKMFAKEEGGRTYLDAKTWGKTLDAYAEVERKLAEHEARNPLKRIELPTEEYEAVGEVAVERRAPAQT